MVEHAAVNRVVVGSSPTSGANFHTVDVQRFSTGNTGKKAPDAFKWVTWATTALARVSLFDAIFRIFQESLA